MYSLCQKKKLDAVHSLNFFYNTSQSWTDIRQSKKYRKSKMRKLQFYLGSESLVNHVNPIVNIWLLRCPIKNAKSLLNTYWNHSGELNIAKQHKNLKMFEFGSKMAEKGLANWFIKWSLK